MRIKCPNCQREFDTRDGPHKYTGSDLRKVLYGSLVEHEEYCAKCEEPMLDCTVHVCSCGKRVCGHCWAGETCKECLFNDLGIPHEKEDF